MKTRIQKFYEWKKKRFESKIKSKNVKTARKEIEEKEEEKKRKFSARNKV